MVSVRRMRLLVPAVEFSSARDGWSSSSFSERGVAIDAAGSSSSAHRVIAVMATAAPSAGRAVPMRCAGWFALGSRQPPKDWRTTGIAIARIEHVDAPA